MARVPAPVRQALLQALAAGGLDARLGRALYPPRNWHQSLSTLHPPQAREALRRGCAGLDASAFEIHLDRLRSSGTVPGHIHWEFVPSAGKPDGLARLLAGLRAGLGEQGIDDTQGHSAHVTVAYSANQGIGTLHLPPVAWRVDAIELVQVAGRGDDYRYEVVEAWPLHASSDPSPMQFDLLR
jgi:2'-5' RNA ligase